MPAGGRPYRATPNTQCAACFRPKREHGGPKQWGLCPGEHGLHGERFKVPDELKEQLRAG